MINFFTNVGGDKIEAGDKVSATVEHMSTSVFFADDGKKIEGIVKGFFIDRKRGLHVFVYIAEFYPGCVRVNPSSIHLLKGKK